MIERDFIVAWRQNAPWPTDAQVEQDLVLSRALVEIFNHPLLSRELSLNLVTHHRDSSHWKVRSHLRTRTSA
jgi:hypothetical protein